MAKLFLFIYRSVEFVISLVNRVIRWIRILVTGIFIGILKREDLMRVDQWFYNRRDSYISDDYNRKPLFSWEESIIRQFFTDCRNIYVLAAGGGREIYNLHKMGFNIDGSEYNEKLRTYGNDFLKREGIDKVIEKAERDKCAPSEQKYEGVILGWGFYTHIKGRDKRIEFLRQVADILNDDGRILCSFWHTEKPSVMLKRIEIIGRFFARITRNEPPETGDSLAPEFVHYFRRQEIVEEFAHAGFELLHYNDEVYAHAVGRKINRG